jgi:hypothetical protein
MKNYPGDSWGADLPFNLLKAASGFLIIDARTNETVILVNYSGERSHRLAYDIGTLLNYGRLGAESDILEAIDQTA